MPFLVWHYTIGLKQYLRRWSYVLGWVIHFFSLTLLPFSLFAPWKRLIEKQDPGGFNLSVYFYQLSFNLVSRTIGAVVRIWLIFIGLFSLIPVLIVGLIGLVFWLVFPPIGLVYYLFRDPHNLRFFSHLASSIQAHPDQIISLVLENKPGRFFLKHLGLTVADLANSANLTKLSLRDFTPKCYAEIINKLIAQEVWDKNLLNSYNLDFTDLSLAASWWDVQSNSNSKDIPPHYSRPGIGLELLYGFTPTLNQCARDLSQPQSFTHHLIGREDLVNRLERTLTGGNSVLLYGLPGVGKKTVVLEFARRAIAGELGPKMTYKRVMELDYNFLLSTSLDINQKKTSLSQILAESAQAGNVILVIKDIHRLTSLEAEGLDFTDIFESHLESGQLKLIALASSVDYERFILPNSRLRKFLEPLEVVTPTIEEATSILLAFASTWESQKKLTILVPALRAIITGTDKYVSDTPFPEKALELLDHVVNFADQKNQSLVSINDVNTVLSEMTGISTTKLSDKEKQILSHLEEVLHQSLIGQDAAVTLIAKSLRARSVGAKSENRPLGSFLFLGPTGVGKTQTAKSLTEAYFDSIDNLLRFDMAEYAGPEGLIRLIGSVNQNQPGRLTSAIKAHPASLLLLDEIEKAPPEVYNLFLSLLDEGSLTDAFGRKYNCKHLFVIATSNAGSEYIRELVKVNTPPQQMQKQVVEYVQQQGLFSPEFLNRFDGVVVFTPLDDSQLLAIAKLQFSDLIKNLNQKNISLEVDPGIYAVLVKNSYDPQFGARPMRREVDITIGDLVGKAILDGSVKPGDKIILVSDEKSGYSLKHV